MHDGHDKHQYCTDTTGWVDSLEGPGNPIANVRMNNRFAFLEFRSIEECSASMNLNNIPFMGSALNLARPAKFEGLPDVS